MGPSEEGFGKHFLVQTLIVTGGLVVVAGGFVAARFFQLRRCNDRVARRLEQRDLESRKHHFRGRPDMELRE
jgi:hypothetical protein